MQITEIKVFPVKEEKLKAFVSIVIDRCFMVNDIKVIKGRDGLFISMPSRRKKNGKFKDVAHPLNNETRQMIERLILGEYEAAVSAREAEQRPAAAPRAAKREPAPAPQPAKPQEQPAAPTATAAAAAGEVAPSPAAPREEAKAALDPPPPAAEAEPAPPAPGAAASGGQSPAAPEPGASEATEPAGSEEPKKEKSLEEVAEAHLRDSFWNS